MRQYLIFQNFIKGDPFATKKASDNLLKLQRGISLFDDTIHELRMIDFHNIPELCDNNDFKQVQEQESNITMDEILIDDSVDMEAIETISNQIDNQKIPAIHFIYWSTIIAFFLVIFLPLILMALMYSPYSSEMKSPISYMQGIANTRSIMAMLAAYSGRYLFQQLDDPKNSSKKIEGELNVLSTLDWSAFGGNSGTVAIIHYIAGNIGESNAAIAPMRNFKPKLLSTSET